MYCYVQSSVCTKYTSTLTVHLLFYLHGYMANMAQTYVFERSLLIKIGSSSSKLSKSWIWYGKKARKNL